jgi:hypothetical protein
MFIWLKPNRQYNEGLINIILQETLTGFKWMGNKADQYLQEGKTVLFALKTED